MTRVPLAKGLGLSLLLWLSHSAFALNSFFEREAPKPVIADLEALRALSLPILESNERLQVGLARLSHSQQLAILSYNHQNGKCGGFEVLAQPPQRLHEQGSVLEQLEERVQKDLAPGFSPLRLAQGIESRAQISRAIENLKVENLRKEVTWLSSFPNRDNRAAKPNIHVEQLKAKLKTLLAQTPYASIEKVSHNQTRQQSLKVRLTGSSRPEEIIVLGGHLDSINTSWFGGTQAPGADDNASGSANLMEILRVLIQQVQPERSVEFFWYAGEESGLLGSSEIAQSYKSRKKDVIAVLQLDMTLFAGSGELTIANITDYTSPWLRETLSRLNSLYVGARMLEDRCGYGCSDHAAWYRQGFSTVVPFEARMSAMNKKIHTDQDVINNNSNFYHSLAFSKLGLAFAMELANSRLR